MRLYNIDQYQTTTGHNRVWIVFICLVFTCETDNIVIFMQIWIQNFKHIDMFE